MIMQYFGLQRSACLLVLEVWQKNRQEGLGHLNLATTENRKLSAPEGPQIQLVHLIGP